MQSNLSGAWLAMSSIEALPSFPCLSFAGRPSFAATRSRMTPPRRTQGTSAPPAPCALASPHLLRRRYRSRRALNSVRRQNASPAHAANHAQFTISPCNLRAYVLTEKILHSVWCVLVSFAMLYKQLADKRATNM